jgi:hypothetical protein
MWAVTDSWKSGNVTAGVSGDGPGVVARLECAQGPEPVASGRHGASQTPSARDRRMTIISTGCGIIRGFWIRLSDVTTCKRLHQIELTRCDTFMHA